MLGPWSQHTSPPAAWPQSLPLCPQGQFIASSPSLFPDEYVLEFQKCLDKTEPVPFSVIERIINQVGCG